jgi:hypothetical protein
MQYWFPVQQVPPPMPFGQQIPVAQPVHVGGMVTQRPPPIHTWSAAQHEEPQHLPVGQQRGPGPQHSKLPLATSQHVVPPQHTSVVLGHSGPHASASHSIEVGLQTCPGPQQFLPQHWYPDACGQQVVPSQHVCSGGHVGPAPQPGPASIDVPPSGVQMSGPTKQSPPLQVSAVHGLLSALQESPFSSTTMQLPPLHAADSHGGFAGHRLVHEPHVAGLLKMSVSQPSESFSAPLQLSQPTSQTYVQSLLVQELCT